MPTVRLVSTSWGYYCVTCEQDSICEAGSAFKDSLNSLLQKGLQHIIAIMDDPDLDVEIKVFGLNSYSIAYIEWLREHQGHEIMLKNEYGDIEPLWGLNKCKFCDTDAEFLIRQNKYCRFHAAEQILSDDRVNRVMRLVPRLAFV